MGGSRDDFTDPDWHDALRPRYHYADTYDRWKQRLMLVGLVSLVAILLVQAFTPAGGMPRWVRLSYLVPPAVIGIGGAVLALYGVRVQRGVIRGSDPPCPGCGYEAGYTDPCPECGLGLTRGERKRAWRDAGYRDW